MKKNVSIAAGLALVGALALGGVTARAQNGDGNSQGGSSACRDVPSYPALKQALVAAQKVANGGLGLDMWGTLVNRDGIVCAVAFTGADRGEQWPGSRVISAQKANTANAFSLPGLALSTANLYTATQPGGSLFGLQLSNPVNTDAAYAGSASAFGTASDPMVGLRIGGINVFGGGLALYNSAGKLVGGLGVSGDTSCADHNIAYRTRDLLNMDNVPNGVAALFNNDPTHKDNAIYDVVPQGGGDKHPGDGQMPGVSFTGFGHVSCHGYNTDGNTVDQGLVADLPPNGPAH